MKSKRQETPLWLRRTSNCEKQSLTLRLNWRATMRMNWLWRLKQASRRQIDYPPRFSNLAKKETSWRPKEMSCLRWPTNTKLKLPYLLKKSTDYILSSITTLLKTRSMLNWWEQPIQPCNLKSLLFQTNFREVRRSKNNGVRNILCWRRESLPMKWLLNVFDRNWFLFSSWLDSSSNSEISSSKK